MIRPAVSADAAAIAAVYAPYVRDTVVSFEEVAPGASEMTARIGSGFPWLVADEGGVVGFAYASQHRTRAAYRWAVDVSVYLASTATGRGLGRLLYGELLGTLRGLGYVNAFAGVTLPNAASVGLHESMGFTPIGVYRDVGYKFGAWHDVGWWQLRLQDPPPAVPRPRCGTPRRLSA